MDYKGLGPLIRTLSILYILYLTLFKNLRIPSLFFILYGIGCLMTASHFYDLEKKGGDKQVDGSSLKPLFYEYIILGIVTTILGIYLFFY